MILLDECTPHVLKRLLTGFEINTVSGAGNKILQSDN